MNILIKKNLPLREGILIIRPEGIPKRKPDGHNKFTIMTLRNIATIVALMGMTLVVNAQNAEQVVNQQEQPEKMVFNNEGNELVKSNFGFLALKTQKMWGYDMATTHVGAEPQETLLAFRPIQGVYISGLGVFRHYEDNNVPGVGVGVDLEIWNVTAGTNFTVGFGSKDAPNSEKKNRTSMDAEWEAYFGLKLFSFNQKHTTLHLIAEYVHLTNKDYQSLGVTSTSVEDREVEGGIERTTTTSFQGESYDNKPYVHGGGVGLIFRHHFTFSPISIFARGTVGMVNSWNKEVTANGKESGHTMYANFSVGVSYNLLPARYNVQAMNKLNLTKADVRKIARESGKRGLKTLSALANY